MSAPTTTDPFDEFARAEADAAEGSSDAMIWLANHYETGVRGGPEANGHKALCYYMAAFRREPAAWAHVMGRVVSDMVGYFNPIAPGGGVRFGPLSDEMRHAVKEAANFSIGLFPELAQFAGVPSAVRCLAVEAALGKGGVLRAEQPITFGDWREAVELSKREDVAPQLRA